MKQAFSHLSVLLSIFTQLTNVMHLCRLCQQPCAMLIKRHRSALLNKGQAAPTLEEVQDRMERLRSWQYVSQRRMDADVN